MRCQNNLALGDNNATNIASSQPPLYASRPPRPENVPPPQKRLGPSMHQQNRSREEEQQRLRNGGKPRGAPQTLDIFADPPTNGSRPRRNSDTSVAEKSGKALSSDEDRKRRERRYRDKEARHRNREARHKDGKGGTSGSKKPSKRLDVIDQLDLTGIYGTGCTYERCDHGG